MKNLFVGGIFKIMGNQQPPIKIQTTNITMPRIVGGVSSQASFQHQFTLGQPIKQVNMIQLFPLNTKANNQSKPFSVLKQVPETKQNKLPQQPQIQSKIQLSPKPPSFSVGSYNDLNSEKPSVLKPPTPTQNLLSHVKKLNEQWKKLGDALEILKTHNKLNPELSEDNKENIAIFKIPSFKAINYNQQ